jgi:hypothetical protein
VIGNSAQSAGYRIKPVPIVDLHSLDDSPFSCPTFESIKIATASERRALDVIDDARVDRREVRFSPRSISRYLYQLIPDEVRMARRIAEGFHVVREPGTSNSWLKIFRGVIVKSALYQRSISAVHSTAVADNDLVDGLLVQ